MTLLNRRMDYALLILCYLNHKAEGGCAREIAGHFRLSRAFVANILKELRRLGFVAGQRGVNGGYVLRTSAAEITLARLMDGLDEPVRLAECNISEPAECCSLSEQCPIRDPIAQVHARIRSVLENVTLEELFAKNETLNLELDRCLPGLVGQAFQPDSSDS